MLHSIVTAVFLTLACRAVCDSACYTAAALDEAAYPRCAELVQNQLWISWKVSDGKMVMAISRTGAGWVSIGIGEEQSGSMKGADMIVVSKIDDVVVAEDRFAVGFSKPVKDEVQNVELVSTTSKDGMFQAIVRRPMMTCNAQDVSIRDNYPHMVLFAFGAAGDWTMQYHGTANRGVSQIAFTGGDDGLQKYYDEVLKSSPNHVLIHYNSYHIPTEDRPSANGPMVEGTNQYKCMAVPMHVVTNLTPPFDIIAGTPVASKYLHHFVNSACRNDPRPKPELAWGQDQQNDIYNCGMGAASAAQCISIPGFAAGEREFVFAPTAGVRVPVGINWFVFDTHFYNPTMIKDAYDSSGYDYVVTTQLRPVVLANVWVGIDLSMRLPFGQKRADYAQHCPAEAIEHIFPSGQNTVELSKVRHHLHQRGNGAYTYIVRDGHRIPLAMSPHYDYNFQVGLPLNVTMKRGDAIEVHCSYDTSEDTVDVLWGERTQDEMCISIIEFSPAPAKSTTFRCVNTYNKMIGHVGSMQYYPADGRAKNAYTYNQTKVNTEVAYPVPGADGKYDLPWGNPLDDTFADYKCKAGTDLSTAGGSGSSPNVSAMTPQSPTTTSIASRINTLKFLFIFLVVSVFCCA